MSGRAKNYKVPTEKMLLRDLKFQLENIRITKPTLSLIQQISRDCYLLEKTLSRRNLQKVFDTVDGKKAI